MFTLSLSAVELMLFGLGSKWKVAKVGVASVG
jgi:hypothetical protein